MNGFIIHNNSLNVLVVLVCNDNIIRVRHYCFCFRFVECNYFWKAITLDFYIDFTGL